MEVFKEILLHLEGLIYCKSGPQVVIRTSLCTSSEDLNAKVRMLMKERQDLRSDWKDDSDKFETLNP